MPRVKPALWWNPNSRTRQKQHESMMAFWYREQCWYDEAETMGKADAGTNDSVMQIVNAAKTSWSHGEKRMHSLRLWNRKCDIDIFRREWEEHYIVGRLPKNATIANPEIEKFLKWCGYDVSWQYKQDR